MSSKFAGVTFDDQAATPSDDAIIRRAILADGILTGCEVSYTGSTLTMTAGQLMICGRQVKHPSTQNWAVADATTGFARLVLTIDLTRTSSKDTFEQVVDTVEYASAVDGFADLVQEDINASGTKYQIVAAVVSMTTGGISGIVSQLGQTSTVMGEKSVIIVDNLPTGSTVTCTKGTVTKTAAERNGEWWFKGLEIGTWTLKATLSGQTATQTVNITQFGVYRIAMTYRVTPEFTYTGNYKIVQDNDSPIPDFTSWKGNWKIRFLTSGTFTVTNMHGWTDNHIDVFLVGGGGSGAWYDSNSGGAGAGGYTLTKKRIAINTQTPYLITIGAGATSQSSQNHGTLPGNPGGDTSAFNFTAGGGKGASHVSGAKGGSGGGGSGGNGGSDGGDGTTSASNQHYRGLGQISNPGPNGETGNTREFGESSGKLYSGGGKSGGSEYVAGDGGGGTGAANTGGGGNNMTGSNPSAANRRANVGGSGIVVIRNAR